MSFSAISTALGVSPSKQLATCAITPWLWKREPIAGLLEMYAQDFVAAVAVEVVIDGETLDKAELARTLPVIVAHVARRQVADPGLGDEVAVEFGKAVGRAQHQVALVFDSGLSSLLEIT